MRGERSGEFFASGAWGLTPDLWGTVLPVARWELMVSVLAGMLYDKDGRR